MPTQFFFQVGNDSTTLEQIRDSATRMHLMDARDVLAGKLNGLSCPTHQQPAKIVLQEGASDHTNIKYDKVCCPQFEQIIRARVVTE